jgi:tetratricopeptide (TPR) repeat protein
LAAADTAFWSGRWTGAEADYRRLAAHGDAHAESHLALLLVYEARFVDAVAEAKLAVQHSPDSDTYARLTRALDWSDDIPAAVAAGAQAVAATPTDPLAFAFDSEALADAGRYDDALAQLDRAESAARTSYERAEALREWSNYYRDRGRGDDAFNYVELAQHAEPSFPPRTVELANEYFGRGASGAADARTQLEGLLNRGDPAVLAVAGDAAFGAGDAVDAERYYRAALGTAPGDPTSSLGLAEVLVAGKKDPKAALDVLNAALAKHPNADAVYYYRGWLVTLVLTPTTDTSPTALPTLQAERTAAYDLVNSFRQKVSLPVLREDRSLAAAAEAHAYYVLFNWGNSKLAGLGIHSEDPSLPGFSGQNSAERDRHFGYAGFQSAEVLNHTGTSTAAVQVWIDSVYHRLPLIGRESSGIGYGEAQVGTLAVNVMDFGVGAAESADPIVFPYQDQTDVPAGFVGNEVPDPAPNARYPVGYPITIAAGGADSLSITSASVTPAGGAAVPVIVDQPGKLDLDQNEAAILPQTPLTPGTVYTVRVRGLLDGRPWSDSWTFQVAE